MVRRGTNGIAFVLSVPQLQVVTVRKRYEVGLEKLATTESSVADMQQELIALQPQLEVSTKETEAAMVVSPQKPGHPSQQVTMQTLMCFCPCLEVYE